MSGATVIPISEIEPPTWPHHLCHPCIYAKDQGVANSSLGTIVVPDGWDGDLMPGMKIQAFTSCGVRHVHLFDFDGTLLGTLAKRTSRG